MNSRPWSWWRHTLRAAAMMGAVVALPLQAQESMLPIEDYLSDETEEVALARSAAPDTVSADATVLVLRKDGYATAHEGSNGFVCMVQRAWSNPAAWNFFWNPRIKIPVCLNPAAAASILPMQILRTDLVLAGNTPQQVETATDAAVGAGDLAVPGPSAMAYMLSSGQYLSDRTPAGIGPHIMMYEPYATNEDWGSNPFGSADVPFVLERAGSPFAVVVVGVKKSVDPK